MTESFSPTEVVKDIIAVAGSIGGIVNSGYKAKAAKEQLRQICKSKQILALSLLNETNCTWCLPKLYFASGEADEGPPLTILPGKKTTWTAASHPLAEGLKAVLTYSITDTKRLVIMFSISKGMIGKSGRWMGRIVDVSPTLAALKNPAKNIYQQLKKEKWNGADCCAYSGQFSGFEILGIMAKSSSPDITIEVRATN